MTAMANLRIVDWVLCSRKTHEGNYVNSDGLHGLQAFGELKKQESLK